MDTCGIVVAAGTGSRFGVPKQFETVAGARLVDRAVDAVADACDDVVLVLPAGVAWDGRPVAASVPGGSTRSASVRAGLDAVAGSAGVVVVHDAARPLASPALFEAVIGAVRAGADAAVPGLPISDTVKRVDGDHVVETIARDALVAVQTPQAFRSDALRAAHAGGGDATDDAALVEAAGGRVVVVPGEPRNLKVTTPADLVVAARAPRRRVTGAAVSATRIGQGFDVHPFGDGAALVLGGVELDGPGLIGHSDADAVAHAVADALLGAAALPDLGSTFPATDDRYRDASSIRLLRDVAGRVSAAGWRLGNVDVVVVAERPSLAPHVRSMTDNLYHALVPLFPEPGAQNLVSVKPKRGEGLGAIGRGEGVAVWAVALLESVDAR